MANPNRLRFSLNRAKLGNYAYFEPESSLHLTLGKPHDTIAESAFNTNVLRAIRNKTIIDVDKRIDLEKGEVIPVDNSAVEAAKAAASAKATADAEAKADQAPAVEDSVDNESETTEEATEEKKTTAKKSTKATAK